MSEEMRRAIEKTVDNAVYDAVKEYVARMPAPHKTRKTEFSKKLILGALFFVGVFIIVSTVAWFMTGDWPREIAVFFISPFIGIASYMLKSACENREKIKNRKEE